MLRWPPSTPSLAIPILVSIHYDGPMKRRSMGFPDHRSHRVGYIARLARGAPSFHKFVHLRSIHSTLFQVRWLHRRWEQIKYPLDVTGGPLFRASIKFGCSPSGDRRSNFKADHVWVSSTYKAITQLPRPIRRRVLTRLFNHPDEAYHRRLFATGFTETRSSRFASPMIVL